ncbi:energy-coupling factor transporter ATPase [Lentibacillus saliphilus]|uniref:energy-coupling factor transporter ATPase n=1 Tax=Lentibacillus saliphilus TaxID=2737028 RepID=UPI001C301EF1|nr:energy-coupling factor transporter ATPase [Lentibacillus saliphilus]
MRQKLVEFRNVSFRYDDDGPWILNDCSFTIYENQSVAIIGHNGSGKSTIAKLMNGLLFPQKGQILIDGKEVNAQTIWDIRKDVGMVFQNPDNQFVGTTVQDDVAFGMENRGIAREEMMKRIEDTLTAVGMQHKRLSEPHRLSGGQKQRVAIASVLAISPKLLILDEATAMLDPKGRQSIMKTVSHLHEQDVMSLVSITHDLEEVMMAEWVIVMNQGEIWAEGTPRDIFTRKDAFHKIGLDIPFVGKLTEALRRADVSITEEPLNHEELLEALWTFHSKT